jgi:hypothetical protein
MNDYVELLRELIRTPSLSREESATAEILSRFISERGHAPHGRAYAHGSGRHRLLSAQ